MSKQGQLIKIISRKIKTYELGGIELTKTKLLSWLCLRNKATLMQLKQTLFDHTNLVHIEKQEKIHKDKQELRYCLYFVYSNRKGRCSIITFTTKKIKIITVFPLGRKTLRKYNRKFK